MILRRFLVLAFLLTAFGAATSGSAEAREVRYFVLQKTGLFEITEQATGGRFIGSPTGENIQVPGVGVLAVRGRTDRATRGETVVTQIRGSGAAKVAVTSTTERGRVRTIFAGTVPLPLVVPQPVSIDPDFDQVVVKLELGGRTITRRLPIGIRPKSVVHP